MSKFYSRKTVSAYIQASQVSDTLIAKDPNAALNLLKHAFRPGSIGISQTPLEAALAGQLVNGRLPNSFAGTFDPGAVNVPGKLLLFEYNYTSGKLSPVGFNAGSSASRLQTYRSLYSNDSVQFPLQNFFSEDVIGSTAKIRSGYTNIAKNITGNDQRAFLNNLGESTIVELLSRTGADLGYGWSLSSNEIEAPSTIGGWVGLGAVSSVVSPLIDWTTALATLNNVTYFDTISYVNEFDVSSEVLDDVASRGSALVLFSFGVGTTANSSAVATTFPVTSAVQIEPKLGTPGLISYTAVLLSAAGSASGVEMNSTEQVAVSGAGGTGSVQLKTTLELFSQYVEPQANTFLVV